MARPVYEHRCPRTGKTTRRNESWRCRRCGERAAFDRIARGATEMMGRYARETGLPPFGPHRPLADKLFREIDEGPCKACEGRGGKEVTPGGEIRVCWICEGTGHTPYTAADAARVRDQVLAEWPIERIRAEMTRRAEEYNQARAREQEERRLSNRLKRALARAEQSGRRLWTRFVRDERAGAIRLR